MRGWLLSLINLIFNFFHLHKSIDTASEKEKGECFERLMKNFLLTYPPFRGKFKNVWLWKNFPHKNQLGGKDLGIDIVAETFDENFVAVQCKFFSDNSTVEKSAVDSFISNSARKFFVDGVEKIFYERIWISTTENYSAKKISDKFFIGDNFFYFVNGISNFSRIFLN